MIIIAPFAQKLRNGKENPKNYPYWEQLISLIDEPIVQVGVHGEKQLVPDFRPNLPTGGLTELLNQSKAWISVDSFFQHWAWHNNKKGVVLWSVSDPKIFGHPENINLLKSRDFLAKNQFLWWEEVPYNADNGVDPEVAANAIKGLVSP
jgi:ADP-heptose:LPS heptosyltransferase